MTKATSGRKALFGLTVPGDKSPSWPGGAAASGRQEQEAERELRLQTQAESRKRELEVMGRPPPQ